MKWLWEHIKIFLSGVLMVISDAIPGFSGGIALTMTNRLHQVWGTWTKIKSPKVKGERRSGILFYVFFICGSISGTFGFAHVIDLMLNNIPSITFWFFISLSIGSIFIYRKVNKKSLFSRGKFWKNKKAILFFILGLTFIASITLATFLLEGRQTIHQLKHANNDVGFANIKIVILLFFGGFFASAAMVTPGMSGALVLLVFGVYGHLYSGLYTHVAEHPWILLIYILGSILGTIVSVVLLNKLYKKWPFAIAWFFYGTVVFSIVAMAWIFNVFIPVDPLRWIYIAISILLGATITTLTLKYIKVDN